LTLFVRACFSLVYANSRVIRVQPDTGGDVRLSEYQIRVPWLYLLSQINADFHWQIFPAREETGLFDAPPDDELTGRHSELEAADSVE
jgi:hypothetical protein